MIYNGDLQLIIYFEAKCQGMITTGCYCLCVERKEEQSPMKIVEDEVTLQIYSWLEAAQLQRDRFLLCMQFYHSTNLSHHPLFGIWLLLLVDITLDN